MHDIFQREIVFWNISFWDNIKLYIVRYLVRTSQNLHMLSKLEIKKNNTIRVAITTPIKREY